MSAANAYRAYTSVSVRTADQGKLILMCYDGAIKFLVQGKEKLLRKDYEAKSHLLNRSQDIVCELLNALNFEAGGHIAKNLAGLYAYMLSRILHADINRDPAAIDEIVGMLKKLRGAWEEIFSQTQGANGGHQPSSRPDHLSIATSA